MIDWDLQFFKAVLINAVQSSFKFVNMSFKVEVSLDIIYPWILVCFIGF